jgi:pimeloyl-ACP methyl ester carboxylesterase
MAGRSHETGKAARVHPARWGCRVRGAGKDAGVPSVAVNGVELYYEAHGCGAPLVVLGGLGQDVWEMDTLTRPLAGRFRVIAIDNRGSGRSSKPPGPYTVEQMAAEAAGVMDHLSLPRAHLAGISLGGRIAMALTLDRGERVDRLVLVSTSPRAAGARWLVRAGMMIADLPGLRGSYRQPRHAMKAQLEAFEPSAIFRFAGREASGCQGGRRTMAGICQCNPKTSRSEIRHGSSCIGTGRWQSRSARIPDATIVPAPAIRVP